MKTKFSLIPSILILFFAFSCTKEEISSSSSNNVIVGNWKMTTSRVILKVNDNGKVSSVDQTRDGTSTDIINVIDDELIIDLNDIFRTKTYQWDYAIKGNEIEISGNNDDISFFTLKSDGNKMTWSMNLEQTKRSLNATKGKNSVLNTDVSYRDKIIENMFTIEFVKK